MKPVFFEADHSYVDEFGKEYIPVTNICKMTPKGFDIAGIPAATLEAAKERGNILHDALEAWVKNRKDSVLPFITWFSKVLEPRYKEWESEVIVWSDEETTSYAGKADLIAKDDTGRTVIFDLKTGSYKTADYQLSMYKRALCKMRNLNPEDIDLKVISVGSDDDPSIVDIRTIDSSWIDTLLSSYQGYMEDVDPDKEIRIKEYYKEPNTLPEGIDEKMALQLEGLDLFIAELERSKKEAEDKEKLLKEQILDAMTKANVNSFEFGSIKVTRVKESLNDVFDENKCREENADTCSIYETPVISTSFDVASFRTAHPDIYDRYTTTKVSRKSYITIKVKETA